MFCSFYNYILHTVNQLLITINYSYFYTFRFFFQILPLNHKFYSILFILLYSHSKFIHIQKDTMQQCLKSVITILFCFYAVFMFSVTGRYPRRPLFIPYLSYVSGRTGESIPPLLCVCHMFRCICCYDLHFPVMTCRICVSPVPCICFPTPPCTPSSVSVPIHNTPSLSVSTRPVQQHPSPHTV